MIDSIDNAIQAIGAKLKHGIVPQTAFVHILQCLSFSRYRTAANQDSRFDNGSKHRCSIERAGGVDHKKPFGIVFVLFIFAI